MKMIQLPFVNSALVVSCAIHVIGVFGCDTPPASSGRTSTSGGAAGSATNHAGGTTQVGSSAGAGNAGYAGKQCPSETAIPAPTASRNCAVSVRNVDPVFTCGQAGCAVKKALDLTCDALPGSPWLSATADGAALFTITNSADNSTTGAQVTTVTASGSQVEDAPELNNSVLPWDAILNSVMSTSSSGKRWFFVGADDPVTIHETDSGWMRSSISLPPNSGAYLAARMVDDDLGYLTYGIDAELYAPHLVTWDGSCWTDQTISNQGTPDSSVLAVDDKKQPWLAWFYGNQSLFLRSPSGNIQDLFSNIIADAAAATAVGMPLRLLPGGLDGTAAFPIVAAGAGDGVRLFSRDATTDSGWRSVLLPAPPETGSAGDGCPSGTPTDDCRQDPCLGSTSCNAQLTATSTGFDLVRTQSGRTFAAWVVYSSQGTYALKKVSEGSELPTCYCSWTETNGTGTADLVLMHVTEAEPILSHFRFDMGGAAVDVTRDVALAARGDTLLVVVQLGGSNVPTLTYLEIDSSNLP